MFNKWKLEKEFFEGLDKFAVMLESQTIERLERDGLACPANIDNARVKFAVNRKYAKILVGSSVRYFVRKTDGAIYASASRNTPNFNRSFGTLNTIDDFDWGEYEGRAKPGTDWRMVPVGGGSGYMTAVPK